MTNGQIASELGRFTKSGDLHHLQRRMKDFTHDEKQRLVENLLAGDDPTDAVRDAKGFIRNADQEEIAATTIQPH